SRGPYTRAASRWARTCPRVRRTRSTSRRGLPRLPPLDHPGGLHCAQLPGRAARHRDGGGITVAHVALARVPVEVGEPVVEVLVDHLDAGQMERVEVLGVRR